MDKGVSLTAPATSSPEGDPSDMRLAHALPTHCNDATYKVRVWNLAVHHGSHGKMFRIRWTVAGQRRSRTFRSYALAQSFQMMLIIAVEEGQPFDIRKGLPLPLAMKPQGRHRKRQGKHG